MRARRNQLQNEIDLTALPAVLKRSLARLLAAAAAVGGLAYGVLLLVPSHFTSEAQIGIVAKGQREAGQSQIAALQVDREAIASRVQELRSPDLARKLAAELKLSTRPEFNSALGDTGLAGALMRFTGIGGPRPGETEEERVLAAYYRALQVYQVKETRVITLSFAARDGDLAAQAANRLIELYQQWLREQGVVETNDASAWLAPEIEKRTRELATAEAEVERFRSTANLFRGGGTQPSGLAEQQLTDLSAELTKVSGQRSEAEARARNARELMVRGNPDAIPDVQKAPVIQGLIAQRVRAERDRAEAATQLLPAHPRMKQLNANVADIRRHVAREAALVVDALEREAKGLALREELARRALDEAKARVGSTAGDRVRLAQLEDVANAKRRELGTLRDRYEAARSRVTNKPGPVEVQVIATARPSSRASWPRRTEIAGFSALATFVLGLVLVLFRELLSDGGRGAERAGPSRGAEPRLAEAPGQAAKVAVASPARVAAATAAGDDLEPHTVADVVQRLIGNSAGQDGYRTLVVGAHDGIDVREEAADIAAGLCAEGRHVVLVDWSLDGAGIASRLGLPASPGFTDLIAGTHLFEDVIKTLPDGDAHNVPCGSAVADADAILDPDRLNLMLDALDEAYGDVIVTGSHAAVRELFAAIEGRFDAGVVVGTGAHRAKAAGARMLLGFDVTEIDVMTLPKGASVAATPKLRKGAARSGRPAPAPAATQPG